MAESWWPAPAKLNLFLHVLGREANGYHRIQTLFQLLDWGDRVSIEPTEGRSIEQAHVVEGIPPETDLSLRAARLLQRETASGLGAVIGLDKHIPPGSGLGGGSSDAATVLVVLNQLWDCGLSADELAELGGRLGADIPVFVRGATAWGEGAGEELVPFAQGERWFVLVFPRVHVSTRELFSDPNLNRSSAPIPRKDFSWESSTNAFEPLVLERHPQLREMRAELAAWGPARMTGTGSCFFIPVAGEARAAETTRALKSRYNVRAVRGVDRSSLHEKLAGAR